MNERVVLQSPDLADGGGGFADLFGDGGANPRCQWERGVCSRTPTHYIAAGDDEHGTDTYCERHYLLTLLELSELHVPTCSQPLAAHVKNHGLI